MSLLRILSTLAVQGVLPHLAAQHQRATGVAIHAEYGPTLALLARVRAGEADIALLTSQGIDDLTAEGVLVPGSRVDLARSYVGIAVKQGAPKPAIGTEAELRAALLAAESVAMSKAGASGVFFAGLIERMGIAAEVTAKAKVIPVGLTAELVARGEAELAVQQMSELMQVQGVELAGPLPMELQQPAVFSGGLLRVCVDAAAARDFLSFVAGSADALRCAGLEPFG